MAVFAKNVVVETRIGLVTATASVDADAALRDRVFLEAYEFSPRLPPHMSVHRCVAILLHVQGAAVMTGLRFAISFDTIALGSPCTGEAVDAQEWRYQCKLVVIGTEDDQALLSRMLALKDENVVTEDFTEHSMTLHLVNLPELKNPSFHFVIAENDDPGAVDCSAWYAVDQDHGFLCSKRDSHS